MEKSDELLIEEFLDKNQGSFEFLLKRYTPSIFNYTARFAGHDNANDLTQEIFIKVWKNLNKFNIKKAHFKTWLFTIARNTITDFQRKKKMIIFSALDKEDEIFADNIEDTVVLHDEALSKLEDKELLNSLLDQIPPHYREVLILYYQEEMTFKEIGELLSKPLNTVKSYHYRALLKLKEMMKEKLI